jgi:hypothetical protein
MFIASTTNLSALYDELTMIGKRRKMQDANLMIGSYRDIHSGKITHEFLKNRYGKDGISSLQDIIITLLEESENQISVSELEALEYIVSLAIRKSKLKLFK